MTAAAADTRCLLSDCDGVIVDSEPVAERVMTAVLNRAFGRDDVGGRLDRLFGRRTAQIIQSLAEEFGVVLGSARREQFVAEIDAAVADAAPPMPDVRRVYESLDLPIAIVSNSSRLRLTRSVQRAGLAELVGEHLYSADEVPLPKPAPDVYLLAAAALRVPPAHCVVVEDSVTGVLAARTAGMRVYGFLGGSHVPEDHGAALLGAGALAVFGALRELPGLLAR